MNDNNKYLDPATNPTIRSGTFEDIFPDDPELPCEPALIDLPGPEGYGGEKRAADSGDFESKVKVFIAPVDEVIVVSPMGNEALFKISKRQCGTLEVIDTDGSRRTLAELSAEEKKIVDYNLYTKCANGKGVCPCNRI